MSRPVLSLACLALFCLLTLPATGLALGIGDTVPPVKAEWIRGQGVDPASAGKPGAVYVVEFWATWCGPCIASMPHLNELHAQYGPKGLVIMGITDEDAAKAGGVVAQQKLTYNVGVQGGATKTAFLSGVGASGIPHAFLVTHDGRLAWHGHPRDEQMEVTMKAMLAGTFDVDKAKRIETLWATVEPALKQGDLETVSTAMETLIELDPSRVQFHYLRYQVALHSGSTERLPALLEAWLKHGATDLDGMVALAKLALDNEDFSLRFPAHAYRALQAATVQARAEPTPGGMLAVVNHLLALGRVGEAEALLDWALASEELAAMHPPLQQAKAYIGQLRSLPAGEGTPAQP